VTSVTKGRDGMAAHHRTSSAPRRARAAALISLAAGVVLSPVLLAGPAFAEDPLPSEPPGGATCAPGSTTDCQQEGSTSTPTPTPTTSSPSADPVTIPNTGGSRTPTLAHTGSAPTAAYGVAGAVLVLAGGVLVVAARRPV